MKTSQHFIRKKVSTETLLAFFFALVLALLFKAKPEVQSNLTPRDLSDVCRVVDSEIRRFMPFLDEYSWDDVTFLPSRIKARRATQVLSAYRCSDGAIEVNAGGKEDVAAQGTFHLRKIDGNWDVVDAFIVGPTMEPSWEWPDFPRIFSLRNL